MHPHNQEPNNILIARRKRTRDSIGAPTLRGNISGSRIGVLVTGSHATARRYQQTIMLVPSQSIHIVSCNQGQGTGDKVTNKMQGTGEPLALPNDAVTDKVHETQVPDYNFYMPSMIASENSIFLGMGVIRTENPSQGNGATVLNLRYRGQDIRVALALGFRICRS